VRPPGRSPRRRSGLPACPSRWPPRRRSHEFRAADRVSHRGAQRRPVPAVPRLPAPGCGAHRRLHRGRGAALGGPGSTPGRRRGPSLTDRRRTMSTDSAGLARATRQIELAIGGMTCASCAARIEKKLNRIDGVSATVNYATEKASVTYPETVSVDDLIATVEATGYTAAAPAAKDGDAAGESDPDDE